MYNARKQAAYKTSQEYRDVCKQVKEAHRKESLRSAIEIIVSSTILMVVLAFTLQILGR